MKITNGSIPNATLTPKQPIQAPQAVSREPGAEGLPQDSNAYTPSPEWLRLLDQLGQQPEVREDRVLAVMERMRQGYYTTSASAEMTAEAKLRSLD